MQACVIVLNYFGAQKTEKCLKSLFGQTIDTIYLVDNSASEPEANRLIKLVESISRIGRSPQIRLLINEDNLGFGKAINRAIRHDLDNYGGHSFYAIMNNDAEATPDMIRKLIAIMVDQEDIALAAPSISTGHGETGFIWYNKYFGAISSRKRPFSFPYLCGCFLLFRRNLVEKDPLFQEDFFMYGEDVLLSWRLQRNGQRIACSDSIKITHEGTGSSLQGDLFYEYHVARGNILLAMKVRENVYELPLLIVCRMVYLFARSVVRLIRYRKPAPLIALFLCWFKLKVRSNKGGLL